MGVAKQNDIMCEDTIAFLQKITAARTGLAVRSERGEDFGEAECGDDASTQAPNPHPDR